MTTEFHSKRRKEMHEFKGWYIRPAAHIRGWVVEPMFMESEDFFMFDGTEFEPPLLNTLKDAKAWITEQNKEEWLQRLEKRKRR